MCGRFTQQRPSAELAALFAAEDLAASPGGRFNLAPRQSGLVVVERDDQRRAIVPYRWGLIPTWAKDARIGSRLINARAETVATTPAFRASFARRRCIVPADGFYEWERLTPQVRQPNLVRRADGEPMAFAGLWSTWRDPAEPDAEPVRTFTIITTGANATLAPIHDRMPAILPASAWDAWLDPAPAEPGELLALLAPAPDDLLERFPVSRRVNDVRNEGPDLVVPLGPTGPGPRPAPPTGEQARGE
jgi:putative SOS response-associated peptidase YedK